MCSCSIRTPNLQDVLDLVLKKCSYELEGTLPKKHQFEKKYSIVVKNCLTICRDNSSRMSSACVDTSGALPEPVSRIVIETQSKVKGIFSTPVPIKGSSLWVEAISPTTSTMMSVTTPRGILSNADVLPSQGDIGGKPSSSFLGWEDSLGPDFMPTIATSSLILRTSAPVGWVSSSCRIYKQAT